jgi:hypothetical protein
MDWPDYLRDQAESYRCLAQTAEDLLLEQEYLELAATCEDSGQRDGGPPPGWLTRQHK